MVVCSATHAQTMGALTDSRDGQTYETVSYNLDGKAITWMAQNLNYEIEGAFAYDNNEGYRKKLGLLYTQSAAKTSCPSGWRLPSQQDWGDLLRLLGGAEAAKQALKSKDGWVVRSERIDFANGNNSSGFNAYPAGSYRQNNFNQIGQNTMYWTFPSSTSRMRVSITLLDNSTRNVSPRGLTPRSDEDAHSCRCIKN